MSDVKWIKICTDIFDDEKILLIESLPDSDVIIVIWFKLLCLAGKMNNSGVFMLNDKIAYTDKMLATVFRRKESVVQYALKVFEDFGMIELVDGVITIPNWGKHQSLEKIEHRKQYQREYQREYRQKQKQLTDSKHLHKQLREDDVNNLEEDIEEDKEYLTISKDIVCAAELARICEKWNELSKFGIKQISKLTGKRKDMLVARIKQYSIDDVFKAIDKIGNSDFLQGKKGDWAITFDWFIKPNNFPKVLDGNYDNAGTGQKGEVKEYGFRKKQSSNE